ncbi:MAG: hypothetical protein AUJ32_01560 [Parcubacteria group bacterium CG1_02_40_82]|uniref:EamA domain-containing protein n=4 Tax=Candidatus Portnoyibacteriota TaxID=1817913 RepID=A0A2M7IHS9_9BACT|nr:MAG: hypothetical protein AUJ32_01560 [Parcubacteria group bacterium CG1_02_40_82]PIQ75634.1 MAG: hypothetical protein COV84_00025 [Candidatus Portnoybacteria bacterium CG11_big_fil_rev_8_21_14_0_20_40_15]PIS31760.1 MAG: hypothetical protein COT41_00945 [Candidatus Portnoybacteria bacterium CG08_land_8_20_14_0_20_40_83]PIW76064.1 MAG: hypothetical protein CO001_03255 [Candidatus Portnoybacteria bacterium CG_4_8_14_3_um_filter_40_10]PIY74230.1 MAG: hypothetical protein COY85_03850 [Candidatus
MNKKGLILVLATAIISGFSIFINKYSVSVINPYVFTFLKNALVALALCSIFLAIKERVALKKLTKKQWSVLGLIGLVGGSVPFLLFFKGLSLTSAAQGSFIHKTMFVYVAILAAMFLREKISKEFLIGALLLILGNLFLLKKLPVSFSKGDLMVLAATFLWAIENVISKYALRDLDGKIVAWGRMFFGSIFILGYLGFSGGLAPIVSLSIVQIGWTAITAGLLFGYVLTWYSGLKYVPVSVATAILMFGSSVTTMLSLASGASVSLKEIAAGVSIMAGLAFIISLKYLSGKVSGTLQKGT